MHGVAFQSPIQSYNTYHQKVKQDPFVESPIAKEPLLQSMVIVELNKEEKKNRAPDE